MKKENVIKDKTYNFAIKIVEIYKYLAYEKKEFILSKQLVRCGTSIGANVEEAIGAHSKKDFLSKITIAYKEARECHYWLRILSDTGFLDIDNIKSLIDDLNEIIRIITRIQITTKNSIIE